MYFKSVIGHLKIQLDTLNTSDCWSMIHSQPKIKFYDSIPPQAIYTLQCGHIYL